MTSTRSMSGRILLLSPPSLASQPERLNAAIQSYDREATDLQMLDRLALGMVILPDSTYSNIIILAGKNDSFSESSSLIKRQTFARIAQSLKRGGYICSQHGIHGEAFDHNEAILAGLIHAGTGRFMKPDVGEIQAVPLRLCRSKNDSAGASSSHQSSREYRSSSAVVQGRDFDNKSVNVGFPDFDHSINLVTTVNGSDDSDAEIIDEDGLLDNSEPVAPTVQPLGCRPKSGKRRRACKDCTCGLSQKLEEEDAVRRANADKQLDSMKLSHGDLAEVDFTAQGRVGSCGNCSLGDAFRCEGCPFIGLPAFQPGEEIRLLNNDAQL